MAGVTLGPVFLNGPASLNGPDFSLVVACFDEEPALPRLFDELARLEEAARDRGLGMETVLVDDGSTDRTLRMLREFAAAGDGRRAVAHHRNRGFGAAMRTGFLAARGRVLVCYDADCTYPPSDVFRLLDAIGAGADVAGATPFAAGAEVRAGPFRTMLSLAAVGTYRLALRRVGRGVTVFTCAFRAYRREVLAGGLNEADDFLAAAELLSRLLVRGRRVVEVPSVLSARTAGASKMKFARTALRHLGLAVRVALRVAPFTPAAGRRRPRALPKRDAPAPLPAWNAELNRLHPMRMISGNRSGTIRRIEERRRCEVLRLADLRGGQRVLDVGAEEGAYAGRIAASGAFSVALDVDAAALGRSGANPAVAADAQRLPFRDRVFDRVVMAEVLEHCPDPALAVAEALRVTCFDGRLVLSVPDDEMILLGKRGLRLLRFGRLLGGLPPGLAPGHLHVFDRDTLRSVLESAGRIVSLVRDPKALAFLAVVAPRAEGAA